MSGTDTDPTVSFGSYALLVLGSASYFLFLFAWFSLPAFLSPIIDELALSNTQAGVVTGAIQLVYIPLALVSGLAIDRVGARNAIAVGTFLIGTANAVRSGATGFVTVLLPTLLLGVGGTAITFGLPKLVSELFPTDRVGSMSSVYLVGAGFGSAAAFGIGRPYLGPLLGGWRPVFWWGGIALIGYAVAWFVVSGLLGRRVDRFDVQDDEQGFTMGSVRSDVLAVVSHRGLRLLVVIGTMRLFINHGLNAWLTTILELRGLAAGTAATVTSLLIISRLAGTVSIPALSDRLSARRATVVGTGAVAFVGIVGMILSGTSAWVTVAFVALVGIGLGGLSPLIRAIPIELDGIGPRLTATANGLIFTVGEIGGFMGPFAIGGLEDASGSFLPGFALLGVGSLVIMVAGYAMEEPDGA